MMYSRAAILFGIEATQGVAATVTPAADAILCDEPDYKADVQMIERNFSKGDLSQFPHMVGRKLGTLTFKHEVRGNGRQQSGVIGDASRLARLFRACGFQLTAMATAADRVTPVFPDVTNVNNPTSWTVGGTLTNTEVGLFDIVVTTGGAATAARVTVSCNNTVLQAAPATAVPVNVAIPLGNTGATILPVGPATWTVGDRFRVMVLPTGLSLRPVTTGYETATIVAFFDGLRHQLTGALGTFSFSADAGGIATVEFTFQGVHSRPTDAAFPTGLVFEETLPPLLQDALITWGGNAGLIVGSMSFDLAGQQAPREDANHAAGYRGYQLQSRAPTGGFTPEATLEASNAFWGDYEDGVQKFFMARIGKTPGNSLVIAGPRVQTSALGYQDRNNDRAYDVGMKFARFQGDDEVRFFFV